MKRLISMNDREYYTHMLEIIEALNIPLDYKWYISGVEAYPTNKQLSDNINDCNNPPIFKNGEFIQILKEEDFQWVWGTFSLFQSNISDNQIRNFDMIDIFKNPKAFVAKVPKIQHPLAILEINAFDSSFVFMHTNIIEYQERFKKLFLLAKDNF